METVAIIGAGVAGLSAAKHLLEAGLAVQIFESRRDLGGVWFYDNLNADSENLAYPSLTTNTSKKMLHLSDHFFNQSIPDYPSAAQVHQYLKSYCETNGLDSFLHLNTHVLDVVSLAEYSWQLTYQNQDGQQKSQVFNRVIVASGRYSKPVFPDIPGLKQFTGEIYHSIDFKTADTFKGKRVLVVGGGSSAADISVALAEQAKEVTLNVKQGAWFIPHYKNGRPFDENLKRINKYIPCKLANLAFRKILLSEYKRLGFCTEKDLNKLPITEHFDLQKNRFTPGTKLLEMILNDKVITQTGDLTFTAQSVCFNNNMHRDIDSVVFCTGFDVQFPYIKQEPLISQLNSPLKLYKHIFLEQRDDIALLGMCASMGPIFPLIEMQARWVAKVFSNQVRLPHPDTRKKAITEYHQRVNPLKVQYADYMDDIAKQIGIRPSLFKSNLGPLQLFFAPITAQQYQ